MAAGCPDFGPLPLGDPMLFEQQAMIRLSTAKSAVTQQRHSQSSTPL